MFPWSKNKPKVTENAVSTVIKPIHKIKKVVKPFYVYIDKNGLVWDSEIVDSLTPIRACSDALVLQLLEQLESEGLITAETINLAEKKPHHFTVTWDDLYSILTNEEYKDTSHLLGIPPIKNIVPKLKSKGTLTDKDFNIIVEGWINKDFPDQIIKEFKYAIFKQNNENILIPQTSWIVLNKVQDFSNREDSQRESINNRLHWGKIRQAAISANAILDNFLLKSIVLTPEKLKLNINKIQQQHLNGIEVIPSFDQCPEEWLGQFDRFNHIPERFDISNQNGVTQIIVTPEVKAVLQQIKKMPKRVVLGEKAEAFIINPLSVLGESAGAAIDIAQFEQSRIEAGLIFDKFSAEITYNSEEKPASIGINIESLHGEDEYVSSYEDLNNKNDLEHFINTAKNCINNNLQLIKWRTYQFEILGNTSLELDKLNQALDSLNTDNIQIDMSYIYDLSLYSDRIEGVGVQKSIYSPYIAKKDIGEGWFPDNLMPIIVWNVNSDNSEDNKNNPNTPQTNINSESLLKITPELEKRIQKEITLAKKNNEKTIEIPELPKPISIEEIEGIIKTFNSFKNDKNVKKGVLPTLILKMNIENIIYEEKFRENLINYSKSPILPSKLLENIQLKQHQLEGVAKLQHLFNQSPTQCRGVILADDMGLGKTLQLLTLLAWALEQNSHLKPALIIAPVSLLENWQEEIARFFKQDTFNVLTVYGEELKKLRLPKDQIENALLADGLVKFLRPNWVGNANIILTTYETLRDFEFSFSAQEWSIMICDEAQRIKNPNTLITRAAMKQNVQFKIACTGTPVENSLVDLWCLFDFIQPGMLGALNDFGKRYRKPIETKNDDEKNRVEELRKKIQPLILRRTKKEVAKDLPKKIIVTDCQTLKISIIQRNLYAEALQRFRHKDSYGEHAPFKNHLGVLQYLRAICTHPKKIGAELANYDDIEIYKQNAPKMAWLLIQLQEIRNKNEKVIIFCEFKDIQRILRSYIDEIFGFSPDVINGDTETSARHQQSRQKRIHQFQNTEGFSVIILSPVAVGFGVNIQAANHVIHYTRNWNPAKEDQATDRAYRIGQTKDVYVYYPIITANDFTTFDVKLNQLLEYKRSLADDMLNGSGDITMADFDLNSIIIDTKQPIDTFINRDDLMWIEPDYFEGLIAAIYQQIGGYTLVYRTPQSNDDGVDVVAINEQDNTGILMQCKSSKKQDNEIAWGAVKDVVTGHAAYQQRHPEIKFELCCFTNQKFNNKSKEQAELNRVKLFNQDDIVELLGKYPVRFSQIEEFI